MATLPPHPYTREEQRPINHTLLKKCQKKGKTTKCKHTLGLRKLSIFKFWSSWLVQKPHQVPITRPNHPRWQQRAVRPHIIDPQVYSLWFADSSHDHGHVGRWVNDRHSESDSLGWGLGWVGDKSHPFVILVEGGVVGEQRGNVSVGTHSKDDEVEFRAVVDLWHADHTGSNELPDDKFVVLGCFFCWCWVVDGVDMVRNNGNLKN